MTTLLLASVIYAVTLPILFTVIGYFTRELVRETKASKIYSVEELTQAKKYASMFGLDNEMEVDLESILEMGRKYEEFLGTEKVNEMVELIESTVKVCYVRRFRTKGVYRLLNVLIQAHGLIAGPSFIVLTRKAFGGDKDGEPTISL